MPIIVTYRFHTDPATLNKAFMGDVVLEEHTLTTDADPLAGDGALIDAEICRKEGIKSTDILDFWYE